MTGEKPGAEVEILYWSLDGPLGPSKFENDLDPFDEEAFAKSHSAEFMAWCDALVAEEIAERDRAWAAEGAAEGKATEGDLSQ